MSTFSNLYDAIVSRIKALGASLTLQRKALSIGSADSATGIYQLTYGNAVNFEGVLITRGAQLALAGTGLIVTHDALLITQAELSVGDLVVDAEGYSYRVDSVAAEMVGDQLVYYSVNLTRVNSE